MIDCFHWIQALKIKTLSPWQHSNTLLRFVYTHWLPRRKFWESRASRGGCLPSQARNELFRMHPTRRAAPVNIYCFNRLDVNYTSADLSTRIESSEISRGDGRGRATDLSKRTPSFIVSADWIEGFVVSSRCNCSKQRKCYDISEECLVLPKSYNIDSFFMYPPVIYTIP